MSQYVRDVMTSNPVTVQADASLAEASRLMRDKGIGNVIVMKANEMCGIVTDRDIVVRGIAQDKDPKESTLEDICSSDLVTLSADDEIDKAVNLMRDKGVRRLPVTDGGKPIGIVSLGDLAVERDRRSVLGEISSRPANQ